MSTLKTIELPPARPLPVLLLADVSGSMDADGKIDALNTSVREMIAAFATAAEGRAEIQLGVVTFGGTATLHTPLAPAAAVQWRDMTAGGGTPMGAAMTIAAELFEDREQIPRKAFRPTVVLVSDGMPTDDWQSGLTRLTNESRANKASRMALAIGADADEAMLRRFVSDPEQPVFRAEDAGRIADFFRFVTMTVTTRSQAANPNQVPAMQGPFDLTNY